MRLYEGRILYIALPDLLYADAAREIAAALNRQKPAGVILDLRQNIGGMTAYGARIAELFIPGQFHKMIKEGEQYDGYIRKSDRYIDKNGIS